MQEVYSIDESFVDLSGIPGHRTARPARSHHRIRLMQAMDQINRR
jgi:hypothetical protein